MKKSLLLFALLAAIVAAFNCISCNKSENDNDNGGEYYSKWTDLTPADSVIYAQARRAFLEDTANTGSLNYHLMQFLSHTPYAVRNKVMEQAKNYQFACRDYFVTVYKGDDAEVGTVTEIIPEDEFSDEYPRRRDTITN